jgi:RHS repeat-associated protein
VAVVDVSATPDAYYRVVTDHLGSVRRLVDITDGSEAAAYEYGPFGELLTGPPTPGSLAERFPFRFVGGLWDQDTGLIRFGARDYDPRLGRWTAKDPILWDGGQANLYEYAHSSPIEHVDLTGNSPLLRALALGLVLGAGSDAGGEGNGDPVAVFSGLFVEAWLAPIVGKGLRVLFGRGDDVVSCRPKPKPLPLCFAAGTPVWTESGMVAIEDVAVGDRVWATEPKEGTQSLRSVTTTFVSRDRPVVEVAFTGESNHRSTVRATPEHPFWVEQRGWLPVGDLQVGDTVRGASGDLRVASLQSLAEVTDVFNLEVDGDHNYYVGELAALAHNSCFEEIAKHALERGRFPAGTSLRTAVARLEYIAERGARIDVANGATIWRHGRDILIRRGPGLGTYFEKATEQKAVRYVGDFVADNGGAVL